MRHETEFNTRHLRTGTFSCWPDLAWAASHLLSPGLGIAGSAHLQSSPRWLESPQFHWEYPQRFPRPSPRTEISFWRGRTQILILRLFLSWDLVRLILSWVCRVWKTQRHFGNSLKSENVNFRLIIIEVAIANWTYLRCGVLIVKVHLQHRQ